MSCKKLIWLPTKHYGEANLVKKRFEEAGFVQKSAAEFDLVEKPFCEAEYVEKSAAKS